MHTLIATIRRLARRARGLVRRVRPWPLRLIVTVLALAVAIGALVELWLPIVILLATAAIAGALISRAKLAGTILVAFVAGIGWLLLPEVPELAVAAGVLVGVWEQRHVAFQRPGGGGQPLGGQPAKAPIRARIPGRTK